MDCATGLRRLLKTINDAVLRSNFNLFLRDSIGCPRGELDERSRARYFNYLYETGVRSARAIHCLATSLMPWPLNRAARRF
jgi:hypothetical protein